MKLLWIATKSFIWVLLLCSAIAFLTIGTLKERIDGTNIDKENFLYEIKPTSLHDAFETPLARFYGERRGIATYEEIPEEIVDALVSIEDREFWNHPGINVKAITRAAVQIIKADGALVQGGSTLTQQLVKMTHLTSEKSLDRKQEEAVLSTILEKNFTKEEIMEMYLNEMFFGNKAYGIKDAVRTYFGQTFEEFNAEPREVRIARAAMLAGMLQAPTAYSPYNSFVLDEKKAERTITRRDIVLWAMKDNKVISNKEYEKTIEMPLGILEEANIVFEEEQFEDRELVHYTLYEASDILNMSTSEIIDSGYDIYTSFNPKVYDILRTEFEKDSYFPPDAKDGTEVEGAAVYLNPTNGEIVAFTGGRAELTNFQGFNRAFMAKRQPGSTLKPVISYGPALESGKFGQFSQLLDKKGHSFNGYTPKDWDGGGRGWVSMQEALRQSWNIPAVWTLQQVGINYSVKYAQKLGIDLSKENSGLSMALGGVEEGVTPFQMADAFQVFANNGIRTEAHAIRKIVDKDGKVLYERKIETEPVINPENARTMKSMLQNAVERGTAARAAISGRKIAGKTGTVQYPSVPGANRDIWFVGFDEELLGAFWMGHDNTSTKRYMMEGSKVPTMMFQATTAKVIKYYEELGQLPDPEDLLKEPPDKVAPVISLNGSSTVSLVEGESYIEAGATAEDDKDGDLTEAIATYGEVDTRTPGTYAITFSVSDLSGNSTKATRTVIVSAKPVVIEEPEKPVEEVIEEEVVEVVEEEEKVVEEKPKEDVKEPAPSNVSFNAAYQKDTQSVTTSWSAYSHSKAVVYNVYRNGAVIKTLTGTSFVDDSVKQGTDYTYYVTAVETESNKVLSKSNSKTIQTPFLPQINAE